MSKEFHFVGKKDITHDKFVLTGIDNVGRSNAYISDNMNDINMKLKEWEDANFTEINLRKS